ncbi:MAG TPA: YggT family protein [Gaiellales bacterium]|nr:YggT family protein [Gaiellales bacterium]
MTQFVASMIASAVSIYTLLILAAVLFTWIRPRPGILGSIRDTIVSLTEPYLRVFRRIVPPLGRIDVSPIVALLTLQFAGGAAAATVAAL